MNVGVAYKFNFFLPQVKKIIKGSQPKKAIQEGSDQQGEVIRESFTEEVTFWLKHKGWELNSVQCKCRIVLPVCDSTEAIGGWGCSRVEMELA